MEIEIVPDPGGDDPAARAALAALEREGLSAEPRPAGLGAPWRRAGLEAALDRDPGPVAAQGPPRAGSAVPRSRQRG